ncbi:MAG TPA: penicillin acylase family protein [Caulobacteraceae bacterium]|nr:penicillin acylase family protein [Caulobacteraceae bacterium]
MRASIVSGLVLGLALLTNQASAQSEQARWREEAANTVITRDDWGIAHVHGKTDADAVFGMIYEQAEDDFNRVETNYLISLGRLAQAEGEQAIYQDLRARLYVGDEDLKARYASSPDWLKRLMDAWADGLNFYLATHPDVHPRAIARFEPWMALSFTEGSIGGDIERIPLKDLESFYGPLQTAQIDPLAPPDANLPLPDVTGSNGFAVAPSNTKAGKALLWINPHTSFYFRSETQMSSDEGLDAYGAATWGQFFIYQGFNPNTGWMHTSTGADVVDEFLETIVRRDGKLFYRYGSELRPVQVSSVTVPYRATDGSMKSKTFTVYHTHHGPIIRAEGDRWVSFAMMYKPVEALEQSYQRTKTHDLAGFLKVADLKANSSNNTIFADSKGEIAYLHPQFVPVRDKRFDYTKPVDGSDPATDWKGLTPLNDLPQVIDPKSGWIENTNNAPWTASAPGDSPKEKDFPRYMDSAGDSPRGRHAVMVLKDRKDFTPDSLRAAAFDSYLVGFAELLPGLFDAYDHLPANDPLKAELQDQVAELRAWDDRWSVSSPATALAVFWGDDLAQRIGADMKQRDDVVRQEMAAYPMFERMRRFATAQERLASLQAASDRLQHDFGSWRTPWGEVNRFQRLTGDLVQPFDDAKPSIPIGFTSSVWGSMAAFGAHRWPGTRRYYGTLGNSFVAVVEFGDKVKARAITAGGESGHPSSPHFDDEAQRYADGNLREVYFWPEQLKGHTERVYHPGE